MEKRCGIPTEFNIHSKAVTVEISRRREIECKVSSIPNNNFNNKVTCERIIEHLRLRNTVEFLTKTKMARYLQRRWCFEGAKPAKTKAQHIHNEFIRTNYTFFVFCCLFFVLYCLFRSLCAAPKVKCLEDWLIRRFSIYGIKTRNDCVSAFISCVFFLSFCVCLSLAISQVLLFSRWKNKKKCWDLRRWFDIPYQSVEDGRMLKAANCWSLMFRFNFNTYKIE